MSETDEAGPGRRWVIRCPGIPHQPSVTHSIRTSHVFKESSWLVGNTTRWEPSIGEAMRRLEHSGRSVETASSCRTPVIMWKESGVNEAAALGANMLNHWEGTDWV